MATNKETPIVAATTTVSQDINEKTTGYFSRMGANHTIKPEHDVKDSFSNLVGGALKVISIERGKISCSLNVIGPILNPYGGMHGGAVAGVAERVAIACVRTIVGKHKHLFLAELSLSYLSTAPKNVDIIVEGCVIKSGRNLIAVGVDFRVKETGRLAYKSHVTFYNMHVSSL